MIVNLNGFDVFKRCGSCQVRAIRFLDPRHGVHLRCFLRPLGNESNQGGWHEICMQQQRVGPLGLHLFELRIKPEAAELKQRVVSIQPERFSRICGPMADCVHANRKPDGDEASSHLSSIGRCHK